MESNLLLNFQNISIHSLLDVNRSPRVTLSDPKTPLECNSETYESAQPHKYIDFTVWNSILFSLLRGLLPTHPYENNHVNCDCRKIYPL